MMPFAGLCAILGMLFIAWRMHEWRESQKAKARYELLKDAWVVMMSAHRYIAQAYRDTASFQSRGYYLPYQDEAMEILLNRYERLTIEMNACAREF
jgi:hypothetical protein